MTKTSTHGPEIKAKAHTLNPGDLVIIHNDPYTVETVTTDGWYVYVRMQGDEGPLRHWEQHYQLTIQRLQTT